MIHNNLHNLSMIACVSCNWGIGKNGKLLFDIAYDKRYFKEVTKYHTVVMGYNTMLSLPDQKPLEDRRNIVLSSSHPDRDGFIFCRSLDELEILINPYDTFVIGGGEIYKLLFPYARNIYLTQVLAEVPADTFFPNMQDAIDTGEFLTIPITKSIIDKDLSDDTLVRFRIIRYLRMKEYVNESE